MTGILYTTRELVSSYDHLDLPSAFLRDKFFANRHNAETEEVVFDKIKSRRKIAPFVSPLVPGKSRAIRGSTATSYIPPYVKPMATVNPKDTLKRRPGERLPMEMDQAARRQLLIGQILEDQDMEITRREESMCAEIIKTGKLEILGQPDHPDVAIDYGRDAALTVALTSTARWGESGVKPFKLIRSWSKTVGEKKGGIVKDVVLGTSAADILLDDTDFQTMLDNRRQASGNMELAGFNGEAPGFHGVLLGEIGQYRFWQYQQTFEAENGDDVDVWPEYGVGLIAPDYMSGWVAYGAIQHEEALLPMDRFPHMWSENNPSRTELMTESAPLPIPENANSTFFALVR